MAHREIKNLGDLRTGTHALVHHLRGGREFVNRLAVISATFSSHSLTAGAELL